MIIGICFLIASFSGFRKAEQWRNNLSSESMKTSRQWRNEATVVLLIGSCILLTGAAALVLGYMRSRQNPMTGRRS